MVLHVCSGVMYGLMVRDCVCPCVWVLVLVCVVYKRFCVLFVLKV